MGHIQAYASTVSVFAPAKLNLNLRVVGRRPDGYHLIRSEVVPVGIFDVLRVRVLGAGSAIELTTSGVAVPPGESNLAQRAGSIFLGRTGVSARVSIHLHKQIPLGAGMGGGSSDAAAVLRSLAHILCPVAKADLRTWALELGADVPFFLEGRPSLVEGIGERILPLASWPRERLVVAFGGSPLATAEVFRRYDASLTSNDAVSTIRVSAKGQKGGCGAPVNDLEAAAILIDPGVGKLKEEVLARGGSAVSMTGSGSAVFGFWPSSIAAQRAAEGMRALGWWAQETAILDQTPEMKIEGEGDDGR